MVEMIASSQCSGDAHVRSRIQGVLDGSARNTMKLISAAIASIQAGADMMTEQNGETKRKKRRGRELGRATIYVHV
jgi:hypothetical protein